MELLSIRVLPTTATSSVHIGRRGRLSCLLPVVHKSVSDCMSERPLVLVSNDDGVNAAGLKALRTSMASWADVYTLAPETEQSAKSHSITLHHPLRFREVEARIFAVDGTPADCVYVAFFLKDFLPRKPDLVVSGINHGPNLGSDIYYSGTVAAAREGALRGVPFGGILERTR